MKQSENLFLLFNPCGGSTTEKVVIDCRDVVCLAGRKCRKAGVLLDELLLSATQKTSHC